MFLALYVGFGILAGIWPLHTWSPDGHASAPTAVSMLHAGVLMKLGAYGVVRVAMTLLPEGTQYWAPLVGTIAVINVVYGAFSAMAQTDLKYVVAYSSVSHMGLVMLGAATLTEAGLNGSVFQMFAHGIMTGLFFALVGLIYEKSHTREIGRMGGFGRRMPGIAACFTLGGLSSLGLPGLAGFVAEILTFLGAWQSASRWWLFPAVLGTLLTAIYVLRVAKRIFWGPLAAGPHGEWAALARRPGARVGEPGLPVGPPDPLRARAGARALARRPGDRGAPRPDRGAAVMLLALELGVAALALVVFLLGLGGRGRGSREIGLVTAVGLAGLYGLSLVIDARGPLFDGAFVVDGLAVFLKQVFLLATLLAVVGGLARRDAVERRRAPRVPRARADLAPRHDGPRLGPRAGAPLRGVRADVDPALRPGRLRQAGRAGGGGVAQVLPGGEPLDGVPGLRALVRLRRDRQHAARRRGAGGGRRATRS